MGAEVVSSCWVTESTNADTGFVDQITRCRISGGEIVDYASDSAVPAILYPNSGSDLTGECWYYTSAVTQYVILAQYSNGDADIGYNPDPSSPGGIVAIGPRLPRCTSEPGTASDPFVDVWNYVTQYIHAPPNPGLSPRQGEGVTGMETFVEVAVPEDHSAQLASGSITLDVFIEVSAVLVDWGDGTSDSFPATSEAMSGYPDGWARHVYETKNPDGLPLTVSYDWTARWRVSGGSWEFLEVPDTATSVAYPVAEIVSVLLR